MSKCLVMPVSGESAAYAVIPLSQLEEIKGLMNQAKGVKDQFKGGLMLSLPWYGLIFTDDLPEDGPNGECVVMEIPEDFNLEEIDLGNVRIEFDDTDFWFHAYEYEATETMLVTIHELEAFQKAS